MHRCRAALICAALLPSLLAPAPGAGQEGLEVTFVVNDAFVKDRTLPGVEIRIAKTPGADPDISGSTGADGRLTVSLAPGTYSVTYLLAGYVPLVDSETPVRTSGQVITTALSMMLESEGSSAARRIRIILNWGSDGAQVRDADSHIICPCLEEATHVYFASKEHRAADHSVELDVDDTDWGGPETITLSDPLPGTYTYWVHDYSGPPAVLGASDVVVRVLFDDSVVGEFRAPPPVADRNWLPFKAVVVEPDLRRRIVRFSAEELATGADRSVPAGYEISGVDDADDLTVLIGIAVPILFIVGPIVIIVILRRLRR